MTRKRKIILAAAAALALVVTAVSLYLAVSDLSEWRDTVAGMASSALDRELTIAGEFDVDLGLVTRVYATEIELASPSWSSEPVTASVGRLDAEIDLRALFSGSIHLPRVEINGGRAIFESSTDGASNWALGNGGGGEAGGPVRLRIDAIRARSLDLVFRTAPAERNWDVAIAELDSTGDESGSHRLSGIGALKGVPFVLRGELGSLEGLANLGAVRHDLELEIGRSRVSSAGSIAELGSLSGLDLEAEASIPEPTELTSLLGLPDAPLRSVAGLLSAKPNGSATNVSVEVDGPDATLHFDGILDSVIRPSDLEADLRYSGPDIRPVAALLGISDLPKRPFDVAGSFRWQGFPIEVSGLEITVGDNRISADGRLGRPPLMLGTDFQIQGSGPNIALPAALAGLDLPRDPFTIDGRLVRVDDGLRIENAEGTIGETRIAAVGFIGDPPGYRNTLLDVELIEPDLSRFGGALGLDLPDDPVRVSARLGQGAGVIDIVEATAEVGDARLTIDGTVTTTDGMVGTDLRFDLGGLELIDVETILDIDGLPTSPVGARGRLTVVDNGIELDPATIEISGAMLAARGLVSSAPRLEGTSLVIEASGGDASIFNPILPAGALQPEAFRATGGVGFNGDAVTLDGVELTLGGLNGRIDGSVGTRPGLAGTDAEIRLAGPSLAALGSLAPGIDLPEFPFSVAGGVGVSDERLELRSLNADLGAVSLRVDGQVALTDRFIGSRLGVAGEGVDLGALIAAIEGATTTELPGVPAEPFTVAANVVLDEVGYRSEDLEITVGDATVSAVGVVGHWPDMFGTDIELLGHGATASLIRTTTEIDGPDVPIDLSGRIRHQPDGTIFDDLRIRIGNHSAEIDGRLGRLPTLTGTSLALQASGPDLSLIRRFANLDRLPELPFEIEAGFDGNPSRFVARGLRCRLGSSDVEGDVRVDLESKPRLAATLSSHRIVAPELLPRTESVETDHEKTEQNTSTLRLSDTPWDLSILDSIDGDLDWSVDRLDLRLSTYRNVRLKAGLEDSRLEIERIAGEGRRGGALEASGSLAPVPDGHRLEIRLGLDDAMVNLAGKGTPPEQFTPLDVSIEMDMTGRSTHEMMSHSDGRIVLTAEHGLVRRGIVEVIAADVLATLFETLNPFSKRDELTQLECAVVAATFDGGVMTLESAAIQTDVVTILGEGTVDFATEKLKLDWVTKPRKGVGLSASAVTNSYVRLGGTLADPNLEIKPLEAVATTGVAVVTMGISVVARGLFDRITAERKVCERALEKAATMDGRSSSR